MTRTLGDRMLTPAETAEYLAVSKSTLYTNWARWGMPGRKVGKHLRFSAKAVEAWVDRLPEAEFTL